MKNVKVAVHGSYFSDNFGDTLLVKLICDRFSEIIGQENVFLARKGLNEEQSSIGYKVADDSEVKNITHLAFAGGGYFGEPSGGYFNRLSWAVRNYQRHLMWLPKYDAAYKGIFGVGVGPISSIFFRHSFKKLAKSCDALLVRDDKSYQYCLEYGVPSKKVDRCVDLALSTRRLSSNSSKSKMALHLTGMSEHTVNVIFGFIAKHKDKLHARGLQINIIVDGNSDNIRSSAAQKTKELNRLLGQEEITFISYQGHEILLEYLDQCALVITGKLHVGICSIALGAKVISIPVHSKTQRLYSQLGVSDFCFDKRKGQFDLGFLEQAVFSYDFNPDWEVVEDGLKELDSAIRNFVVS